METRNNEVATITQTQRKYLLQQQSVILYIDYILSIEDLINKSTLHESRWKAPKLI